MEEFQEKEREAVGEDEVGKLVTDTEIGKEAEDEFKGNRGE